jgi:hypothetical protein
LFHGNSKCFLFTQDSELLAGLIDDSQLWCLNGAIQAGIFGDKLISRLYIYNVAILTKELTEVNA